MSRENSLRRRVREHVDLGSRRKFLGFVQLPAGYALMQTDIEDGHYYWLRWDGAEGSINVDKWAVYYEAVDNYC